MREKKQQETGFIIVKTSMSGVVDFIYVNRKHRIAFLTTKAEFEFPFCNSPS